MGGIKGVWLFGNIRMGLARGPKGRYPIHRLDRPVPLRAKSCPKTSVQVTGRGIRICKKFRTRNKSKRNLPVETGEDKEEQRPGERKLPPGRNAERDVMKKVTEDRK